MPNQAPYRARTEARSGSSVREDPHVWAERPRAGRPREELGPERLEREQTRIQSRPHGRYERGAVVHANGEHFRPSRSAFVIVELERADDLAPFPRDGHNQPRARVCGERVVAGAARDLEPQAGLGRARFGAGAALVLQPGRDARRRGAPRQRGSQGDGKHDREGEGRSQLHRGARVSRGNRGRERRALRFRNVERAFP